MQSTSWFIYFPKEHFIKLWLEMCLSLWIPPSMSVSVTEGEKPPNLLPPCHKSLTWSIDLESFQEKHQHVIRHTSLLGLWNTLFHSLLLGGSDFVSFQWVVKDSVLNCWQVQNQLSLSCWDSGEIARLPLKDAVPRAGNYMNTPSVSS